MIKALVFDCFGVFVSDTFNERFAYVWNKSEDEIRQIQDIRHATDRGFLTQDEAMEQLAPLFGMEVSELAEEHRRGEVLNENLVKYVKSLRKAYKTALLSNVSGRDYLERLFSPHSLDEVFDVVVASGDHGTSKPSPDIYEKTADLLGVSSDECVMIDDNSSFCEGAEYVGMRSIKYLSYEQAIKDIALLFDSDKKTV